MKNKYVYTHIDSLDRYLYTLKRRVKVGVKMTHHQPQVTHINILYFAGVKEVTNIQRERLEITDVILNDALMNEEGVRLSAPLRVSDVMVLLSRKYEGIDQVFKSCIFAINEAYVSKDTLLKDDDLLAIIPPVSGG